MLCEKCKKNKATVFYEENINGKKRSYSLCEDCAAELQKSGELPTSDSLFDNMNMSFTSPFAALHDSLFGSLFGLPESVSRDEKRCPSCGSTFEDFSRRGKAGCPDCYKTFAEELEPTVRSIHGNAKHEGRAPLRLRAKHEKESELKTLKKELKEAIDGENFEKAAELRDKIKNIEGRN